MYLKCIRTSVKIKVLNIIVKNGFKYCRTGILFKFGYFKPSPHPPISSRFMIHITFPVAGNAQPILDCECPMEVLLLFYYQISLILPALLYVLFTLMASKILLGATNKKENDVSSLTQIHGRT
jgi:hypothetical protein